jgi:low affinity Fe/Cu permease
MHHRASHAVSNVTTFLGSVTAIGLAVGVVLMWGAGLIFVHGGLFNAHYEFLITSVTTIITFVMVFIIQSTQNRESRAMQTKLDALLIAKRGLDEGELLGLEDKPDATIKDVQSEVHDVGRPDVGRPDDGRPDDGRPDDGRPDDVGDGSRHDEPDVDATSGRAVVRSRSIRTHG